MDKINEKTILVRGSPSTLIYLGEEVYLIDPGHGSKRAKTLRKTLNKLGADSAVVILTHYHSDHVNLLAENKLPVTRIVSSNIDRPGIEYPIYRVGMTFGLPVGEKIDVLMYEPKPVRVNEELEYRDTYYGDLKIHTLPGHTPGHIGVSTPEGVFYAGDLVFGDKVLERYPVPYHLDPCVSYDSIRKLESLYESGVIKVLVPGHGPVVKGDAIREMLDANLDSIKGFRERVLDALTSKEYTLDDLVGFFIEGRELSPGLYMLASNSLKGMLTCLLKEKIVEAFVEGNKLYWRAVD